MFWEKDHSVNVRDRAAVCRKERRRVMLGLEEGLLSPIVRNLAFFPLPLIKEGENKTGPLKP